MPDLSKRRPAYRIALIGLMLSLALVLSLFESMLPALPFLPVGVKLGLSNIVTMYCLFFLGARPAFAVAGAEIPFCPAHPRPDRGGDELCGRHPFACGDALLPAAVLAWGTVDQYCGGYRPQCGAACDGGAAAALCFCFLLPPGDDPFRDPDGNAHRASAAVRYALSAKSG